VNWDEWIILTCGVAGVVLAQIPATQKWACFAGLAGQIGWFHAVSYSSQPGIWLTCLVYALAWGYGLWLHWLWPLLEGFMTPTGSPTIGPALHARRKKPSLRLVNKSGKT
jgi:hypothetical protein